MVGREQEAVREEEEIKTTSDLKPAHCSMESTMPEQENDGYAAMTISLGRLPTACWIQERMSCFLQKSTWVLEYVWSHQ